MFYLTSRSSVALVLISSLLTIFPPTYTAFGRRTANAVVTSDAAEATAALAEGKRLLRLYRADQAYNYLQTAYDQFTKAGDAAGAAAAQDAMGDLYTLSGQYALAIKLYRNAYNGFQQVNDAQDANVLLGKIGERYFLLGDTTQARAAFAAIKVDQPQQALENAKKPGNQQSAGGKQTAVAGATALASLSSCLRVGGPNGNNNDPSNPPNEGHPPTTPYGSGRLDLRITNESGQPVQGVKAQLQSQRPGGIFCDCWNTSDQYGRALMPPLHIAPKVKLVLKAPGMATQELTLTAEDLAQPVRVVLSSAGATIAGSGSSNFINSAATPCFSFYRALIAFATSELGVARADYNDNKLAEARTRYENLIKQLDIPGAENLREVPLFRTAARTALGDIAFKEGRYADAARLYKEAIDGANKDKRPDLLWAAQRGLGRSLWQQSLASPDSKDNVQLRNDSFLAYQQALKTIEMLRAGSLRADDARSTFLANTKDVYDEAAAILANMALLAAGPKAKDDAATKAVTVNTANRGFASDGYNTIEHGRARSLLEMLAESQASITQGVPADLIKRRDEIIQRQKEIADTLMGISLPGSGLQKTVPDLEDELDRLEIEYNGLENQIRTSNPRYASLTGAEPMPMSQVQQKVLDDKTVLLLYSLGADQSFLWVVTPQGLAISRLPARATIEDQVLKLRSQMIPGAGQRGLAGIDLASDTTRSLDLEPDSKAPSPAGTTQALNAGAYATAANDLYNTILKPAESLIQGKRLLVVPDGALNYTPFEALVTAPPSGTASYATLSYLVTTNEVAYAPSASVISEVRQQSQQARAAAGSARTDEMLIVADPVFSSSDVRLKLDATSAKVSTAAPASTQPENTRELTLDAAVSDVVGPTPASGLKIPRLVNTRTEAQDIGKLIIANKAKADIWLDLDASENNLLTRDVRSYRILHFATHGLLNTEHPQFTGIVLSLVGDQQDDGFLRVNEIFNLRLGAPLVMLSACETGLGREKRGEGIIGLTRAFMYAGAPTVGVSLWAVADRSTARLMTDFYEGYLGTSTATATGALRDAKLKMISSQQFSAPFYWAPFVIIGDWSRTWQ